MQAKVLVETVVLANFVSLVPIEPESLGAVQLWQTHDEFLAAGRGPAKEHAHLLMGLFLTQKVNAYLVAGCGADGGMRTCRVQCCQNTVSEDQHKNPICLSSSFLLYLDQAGLVFVLFPFRSFLSQRSFLRLSVVCTSIARLVVQ